MIGKNYMNDLPYYLQDKIWNIYYKDKFKNVLEEIIINYPFPLDKYDMYGEFICDSESDSESEDYYWSINADGTITYNYKGHLRYSD